MCILNKSLIKLIFSDQSEDKSVNSIYDGIDKGEATFERSKEV